MIFIGKQLACQKFIYKIHSSRLRAERWKLTLPIDEARRNEEVISLADSQMLRWIDELNGITDAEDRARDIKRQIRQIRKEENSGQNKKRIRQLYKELDEIQFKPDYMCLIIDRKKDYIRACKGFSINGIRYKRLLGTNGGIKNSTIVFVSERLCGELRRRVENDRNKLMPIVTAKLEAYKALACSASIPVSMPNGILVVNDAETEFVSDIIYLDDDVDGEPEMEEQQNIPLKIDASDGYGIMMPSLAKRWSEELGLDYIVSGLNTRFSFEKGMVFTFDFQDFAENVAHEFIVRDAWGNDVDVRQVELIMTTSMIKLWDSYASCDEYISKSVQNGYTFGIAKACPEELESERSLNYQFIQSYELSDDDIEELIKPTMDDIRDALGGDWRKAVLFLKGSSLTLDNVDRMADDFIKAIMIDRRVLDDPYVQNSIYQLIHNRINQAKVGVLKVHGNYSMISGDPYLLCQSIFGLPLTGLLKAGEIFNKYWDDVGATDLACFRAPMTCHNNIRLVHPANSDAVRYWFRYINTATIMNAWDTALMALNGADLDGDMVMLTDNRVLVDKLVQLPALMCAQKKAEKRISSEDDFIRSNIESFGNDIGQTTNWITSMFEVRSHFPVDSKEYKILTYRIQCGQLYQQNAIDRAKGIICKPMARTWHERHSVNQMPPGPQRDLYRAIVADKKPYFMRYIYPALAKQYNTYIKNTDKNAMREFRMTVKELEVIADKTDRQREFLDYYYRYIPVGIGDCVMNRICRRFEQEFDGHVGRHNAAFFFDINLLKSDAEYLPKQYTAVKKLFEEYNRRVKNFIMFSQYERVDEYDAYETLRVMNIEFYRACNVLCPNSESLCNILVDLCYSKNLTKRFAWDMAGETIIQNILNKNDRTISVPVIDEFGDLSYGGKRFSIQTKKIEVTS